MTLINQAITILKQGGLVAFPTETVYGLGADARNPSAVARIFQAKGRPLDHPVIVHVSHVSQLVDFAREIPESAKRVADVFWPGPLTLILKKQPDVLACVTGGQDTVGLRIPSHPVAQALLKNFSGGIVAPSANRFGKVSPTTAKAVREELGDSVDLILEGGECEVGLESTILDLSGETPVILRPGMITQREIETVLNMPVGLTKKNAPRVSGTLENHYAPETPLRLVSKDELSSYLENTTGKIAVVVYFSSLISTENRKVVHMPKTVRDYAHNLYQTLRDLDNSGFQQILVETPPNEAEWAAVLDRLRKASVR